MALADARKDYSAELKKYREELRRTEERLEASEKRALLEIDHERQMTAKVQRDLQQLREVNLQIEERQRTELAASKAELAKARQQVGISEGKLDEIRSINEQQTGELSAVRQAQARLETQLALLQREVELAKEANQLQASNPAIPRGPRRNRKLSV